MSTMRPLASPSMSGRVSYEDRAFELVVAVITACCGGIIALAGAVHIGSPRVDIIFGMTLLFGGLRGTLLARRAHAGGQ